MLQTGISTAGHAHYRKVNLCLTCSEGLFSAARAARLAKLLAVLAVLAVGMAGVAYVLIWR